MAAVALGPSVRARLGTVHEAADVFLVAENVVQAVFSERAAALGRAPLPGQLVQDGGVAGPGRVHLEDQTHSFGFVLVDDVPLVRVHIVAQRRCAAAGFSLAGHEAHFLNDLLPCDQDVHLVKQCHCAFVDKDGRVKQVTADKRLCYADHPGTQGLQFPAKGEPLHHIAEHPALVIDHHDIRARADTVLRHHAVIFRAVLTHTGDRLVGKNIQDGHLMLPAILGTFFYLDGRCVGVLVVGTIAR